MKTRKEEQASWMKTICILSAIGIICGLLTMFGLASSFKGSYLQHSIKHLGIVITILSTISFFVTQYKYRKNKIHQK